MKKLLFALSLSLFFACNNENQTEEAEDMETMETMDTAEPMADVNNLSENAREFAMSAASGGMMEVELGRMATEKAQSQEVKDFGQMMVNDHGKANDQLKSVAANLNLQLPQQMKEKHQEKVSKLQGLSGQEFDKEYMDLMAKDHEEDVSKFENMQNEIQNPEFKNWVSQTLPVLRKHLEQAKQINQSMQ